MFFKYFVVVESGMIVLWRVYCRYCLLVVMWRVWCISWLLGTLVGYSIR